MIHLENINKTYHNGAPLHVLKGINLNIKRGEFVSIMGASGSGKSTLLNILGILDNYDSGNYYLNDVLIKNLSETKSAEYRNRMIGFIFQSFNLISFKNAMENVALPLFYQGVSRKKRNQLAMEYLEKLGLKEWAHHMPNELSGGQKQRVAIARALISKPQIILADEPTGALDSKTSVEVMQILKDLHEKEGLTIVVVTHESGVANQTDKFTHTFPTRFAVAWGIFMLIVLLGAGNGLINAFESNAGGRALNSMKIYPGWTNKPFDGLKEGRSIKLTEKDMEITSGFTDNVTAVGATIEQSSVNLSYGEDNVSLMLEGVTPEYLHIDAISIKTGRFINKPDIKEKRKVILLHEKTVEMLFGKKDANVIGKYVNASGLAYQVVGVYTDMGNYSPSAYIPFTTLQLIYNKGDKLETLVFLTQNLSTEKANEDFEKQYRQALSPTKG